MTSGAYSCYIAVRQQMFITHASERQVIFILTKNRGAMERHAYLVWITKCAHTLLHSRVWTNKSLSGLLEQFDWRSLDGSWGMLRGALVVP